MFRKAVVRVMPLMQRNAAVNKIPIMALQTRMLSSFEGVQRGASKLGKALEKEIKYENDNYT
jgi:hypothetical protein